MPSAENSIRTVKTKLYQEAVVKKTLFDVLNAVRHTITNGRKITKYVVRWGIVPSMASWHPPLTGIEGI